MSQFLAPHISHSGRTLIDVGLLCRFMLCRFYFLLFPGPCFLSRFQAAFRFYTYWAPRRISETRMHSSRMRTVRCSGRLLGGGCLPRGMYSPDPEADTPWTE